ncbi:hypothetical protein SAMN05421636_10843 [Pricia antarctica]|uniref:Bor protein n=1 Tax=Pricia antarctica TaxID=641691 RepID=A0A1G7GAE7_9FLAO|nr:hypothetical protein [Pricia antarctica]SDE85073.1 hypothetical protein SAMN05421636_10843 [Pricia antarctica]
MKLHHLKFMALVLILTLLPSSCVSTRVEASPYQDSVENLECRKESSWSYYWGLKQKRIDANPDVSGNACPCREGALSWVVVKTSFTDFLLSSVTLGIVNHRTATYGCARPQNGEVDMDN